MLPLGLALSPYRAGGTRAGDVPHSLRFCLGEQLFSFFSFELSWDVNRLLVSFGEECEE